jgi:hypothetical protein
MNRCFVRRAALFTLLAAALIPSSAYAATHSEPEEIEWTWEVRPAHADQKLPNVLLVGDSISRNYFPEVKRQLDGVANVYLLATSICVGDPRLPYEIKAFAKMEDVPFRVVHFNNGMHGWTYSEAEYKAGFPAYLKALHFIAPKAIFIWTTTTPVRKDDQPGATNARIDARNAIAQQFVHGMVVDDQHALMEKHQDLHKDNIHFNTEGSDIGGVQAADLIRRALKQQAN